MYRGFFVEVADPAAKYSAGFCAARLRKMADAVELPVVQSAAHTASAVVAGPSEAGACEPPGAPALPSGQPISTAVTGSTTSATMDRKEDIQGPVRPLVEVR